MELENFISVFDKYVTKHNIEVKYDNDNEFYFAPKENYIHLGVEAIEDLKDLYKSFHEACHSTCNITNRDISNYAVEEITADMAAGKLLHSLGVFAQDFDPEVRKEVYRLALTNVSYSSCWMKRIMDDKNMSANEIIGMVNKNIDEIVKTIGGNK